MLQFHRSDVYAIARHLEDVKSDLRDSLELMELNNVRDLGLVLAGVKYLREWLPDLEILDYLDSSRPANKSASHGGGRTNHGANHGRSPSAVMVEIECESFSFLKDLFLIRV